MMRSVGLTLLGVALLLAFVLLLAVIEVPRTGETVDLDRIGIEVVDADGQRINKVRFQVDSKKDNVQK